MGVSNSQPWCGRRGHSEKGQPASPRGVGIGSSRVRPGPRNRPSQGRRVLRAAFAAPSSREQACTPTHRDEGLGAAENDSRGPWGPGRGRMVRWGDEGTWGRERGCLRGVSSQMCGGANVGSRWWMGVFQAMPRQTGRDPGQLDRFRAPFRVSGVCIDFRPRTGPPTKPTGRCRFMTPAFWPNQARQLPFRG